MHGKVSALARSRLIRGVTASQGTDNRSSTVNGQSEPSGGGATTLDYVNPLPLYGGSGYPQLGWVVIKDPNGNISDLIHFDNSNGSGGNQQLFFYSSDNLGQAADHWVSSVP